MADSEIANQLDTDPRLPPAPSLAGGSSVPDGADRPRKPDKHDGAETPVDSTDPGQHDGEHDPGKGRLDADEPEVDIDFDDLDDEAEDDDDAIPR